MAECKEQRSRNTGGLSIRCDATIGHFGQIRSGRWNDFHLEQKHAWKGIEPSRRAFSPDMFVIPAPQARD
jgi:hypothetical protein